ncbi:AI-2E family transporter [Streptomyces sp. NPDC004393]|uniref:AI-2E family transporter n=1 Tax=Streptomyces sp. NPDC004533 TaxID=3154278 RepID=UPI0033A2C4F3
MSSMSPPPDDDNSAGTQGFTSGPPTGASAGAGGSHSGRRRVSRRGGRWFRIGFWLGLGATVAWLAVQTVLHVSQLLTLILLALFVAIGLEPVVTWLTRHHLRRGGAVAVVVVALLLILAGFVALIEPPVAKEVHALIKAVPTWLQQLHDRHSALGKLEDRYHLISRAKEGLTSQGATGVVGGLFGAGKTVLNAVTSLVIVVITTLYLMSGLPVIKRFCLRFTAASKRGRIQEITDEILNRTGRFLLGNIATSVVAGLATFAWCWGVGVPYPAALGLFVALMDLIPIVGSTIAGVIVSLVALSVSLPIAGATAGFYIAFRLAEDYLIMPKAMRYAVDVHPIVTVVGVLIGGALLGIIGALVAIPVAVAIGVILEEYVFTRTDAS